MCFIINRASVLICLSHRQGSSTVFPTQCAISSNANEHHRGLSPRCCVLCIVCLHLRNCALHDTFQWHSHRRDTTQGLLNLSCSHRVRLRRRWCYGNELASHAAWQILPYSLSVFVPLIAPLYGVHLVQLSYVAMDVFREGRIHR